METSTKAEVDVPDGIYFITNVDYVIQDKSVWIALVTKDTDNKRRILYTPFIPYFFIMKRDRRLFAKSVKRREILKWIRSIEKESVPDFYGNELLRVNCIIPTDVAHTRDNILEDRIRSFEADVLFHLRYLIDKNIKVAIEVKNGQVFPVDYVGKYNILFLDIEMIASKKVEITKKKAPIVVIGFYDNNTKKYYIYYLSRSNRPIILKDRLYNQEVIIKKFDTEIRLLKNFKNKLKELQPDIILSFSDLDMRYVLARMKKFKIPRTDMSPFNRIRGGKGDLKIAGMEVLDIAKLYRKVFKEMKWHTLDFICRKEFDIGKVGITSVPELVFKNDWSKLINYNLRDIELIVKLEETLGLISDFYEPIREIVGCNLKDAMINSRLADVLYLRLAHNLCKLPSRRLFDEELKYKGALVLDPITGVHKNVHVFDWAELYPSIIETWNLGINTFSAKGDIKVFDKHAFRKDIVSWTTTIIAPLRERRRGLKKLSKSEELSKKERTRFYMKAFSLKTIINAAYGLLGYQGGRYSKSARLHDRYVAETVTYLGREIMKHVEKICSKHSITVIYGDTDSIFVQSELEPQFIEDLINNSIEDFCKGYGVENKLSLSYDTTFVSLVLLSKKRYKGKTIKGDYVTKGIESIRSDQALATSITQTTIIDMFLDGERDFKILEYYRRQLSDLEDSGDVELLAVAGRCTKKKPKVANRNWKAFYYSRKYLGIELEIGTRFYWIYIKSLPKSYPSRFICPTAQGDRDVEVEAIAFNSINEIPKGTVINTKKMIQIAVRKKVEEILDRVGIDLDKYDPSKMVYYT